MSTQLQQKTGNTISNDIAQESRTFLRWVNSKLRLSDKPPISDVQTGLNDGMVLVELVEMLSGRKIGNKFTKINSKLRQHHLDRVTLVLECLRTDNVNTFIKIDPSKIISGNIETILAVLWSLIWHYSIASTIFESPQINNSTDSYETKKHRLLQWIQIKVPKLNITNFTSDWRNGEAIGALINAIAPGLCADHTTWNDKNRLNNTIEAMTLARDWLDIQMFILAEELISGYVNEKTLITYLSQFTTAKLRSGAPLRAKRYSNRISAYGPGISPFGAVAHTPANFTVETVAAGKGSIDVHIRGPTGLIEKADVRFNNDEKLSYSVSYIPKSAGDYKIFVTFLGKDIPNSPFNVHVTENVGDISKIQLLGPGLQPEGNYCGKTTYFDIIAEDTECGIPEVIILDPAGHKTTVPVKMRQIYHNQWRCEYSSNLMGLHSVNVFFGGVPVRNSPFGVKISSICDSRKIRVKGRGIQAKGIRNGDVAVFFIHTTSAGIGTPEVKIVGPGGINQNVDIKHVKEDVYECHYYPTKEGRYVIMIKFGKFEVPKAPFEVIVGPRSQSSIVAYGPGLKGGIAGLPASFVVEMNGETGALAFSVAGPSQAEIECHDNGDGSALVRYLPTVPGEYAIHILCDNEDINKSPFIAQIQPKASFRPDLVRCSGTGIQSYGVMLNCATEFRIDVHDAGVAPLEINIQDTLGTQLQYTSSTNENGITTCCFTPKSTLPHVIEVNYGGVAASESPYRVYVSAPPDVTKIRVFGDWFETKTKLNEGNNFKIDTSQVDYAELNVYLIHEESGMKIPVTISNDNGVYTVDLNVKKPGNYLTKIYYGGIPLSFTQKVYVPPLPVPVNNYIPELSTPQAYPEKVKVFGPAFSEANLYAGVATYFNIDVSEAGQGIVAVCIFNMNGIPVDNVFVVNKGGGLYTVNFIPPNEKSIVISVKFAHQNVNSSPFLLTIITKDDEKTALASSFDTTQSIRRSDISLAIEDHSSSREDSETTTQNADSPRYRRIQFNKLLVSLPFDELKAQVKMPSGKIDLPVIEDNFDGTIRVQYNPTEDGVHELVLLHNGTPVQGSPYKFHVDSQASGCLTAYGPGLSVGKTGEPCVFTISTKGAEVPLLSLSVEGPSKAKISYTDNKDGTILVTFLPTEAGDYKISVRFGDKHIAGSPFMCKVEGDGKKLRNQLSIGSCSQVTLPGVLTDADLRSLNAVITTPSGIEEPCFLKRLPSGNIGISFTPRETGEHTVSVKRMGKQIKNSPFKINVSEREVGNAKKVKVTGAALENGKTHTDNTFIIDTREAGYGGLSLSIEGPSKAQIKCLDQVDGTLQISYKPTVPGNYILNLKFADHHVEGSPFNIKVSGEGKSCQRENISQQTSAVPSNDVGSKCKLTFKMPGITSFDLAASVTSPKGVCQDAEVQEVEDGLYAVHFVPKEEGVHTISVRYTDIHIPGSPFQFTVGPFVDSGSHLVKAGGSGLEFGEVGVPAEFNIWTREAGEGKIAISIEGPSKAEINFKDRKDGSCNVAYTVKEPGEYHVSLKFNERHIPDSPWLVKFSPPAADAHKVEIAQFPQGAIQTNTPSQFLIRKNGAKGDIDAKIVSPSNLSDDCFVQNIDSEETSVRFYPREEGIHAIHVKLNGVHIPGSPYRVRVGKDVADASAIKAEGAGLKDAVTGQKSHVLISTLDAGSGTLSVTVDGPAKVSLDCTETDDGYKARYTPFLPGEYYITLKYNNTHVVGSPFKVNCTGKAMVDEGGQESTNVSVQTVAKHSKGNKNGPALPVFNADATKVTIKGMGIKKAFVGKQNQFTVNCSEAGHSILFVGLYNPKGPCEEVQVKHTGKNTFTVNYYIRERGEYTLLVMWGENHIAGSPFAVEVPTKC